MKQSIIHVLIIVSIAGVVFFTHLGTPRLWDRDEPRNAGCAVEMLQRGDLIVPTFNDELRHQKPILLYWLIISAYQLFGVSEFSARFWSAALAIGTVLSTYAIGRRLLNPTSALYGAIALSTSMMFVVAGRAATPDSVLIFCSTMAITSYVMGTFAPKKKPADAPELRWDSYYFPQSWPYILGMYSMMGLGVLAKGPVGVLLPSAIIGMFMLIQRQKPMNNELWNSRGWLARMGTAIFRPFHPVHFATTVWKMRPITAALIVTAIALPWYVAVGLQTEGQWLKQFFFNEHLGRATIAQENHGGGFWYYPVAILLGFFPWSVFIGPALVGADRHLTRKHHWSPAYCFLLCWAAVQIGLFSFVQTKLPSYVTPCYPAMALLVGAFLWRYSTDRSLSPSELNRLSFVALGISGVLIVLGFAIVGQVYLDGNLVIALLGIIPVVAAILALWFSARSQQRMAVLTCCFTAVLFAVGLFGIGATVVDRQQTSDLILDQVAASPDNVKVATYRCLESSWVFYGRRAISELSAEEINPVVLKQPGDPSAQSELRSPNRQKASTHKTWQTPSQFAADHPDSLIITTDQHLEELQKRLPKHYRVIQRTEYFLRGKDLVLLGPVSHAGVAARPDTIRR